MICFDRIKRKSLSYPVWYAKLLQTKRAWSASGCPGGPGLPDSQSRFGGMARRGRNVRIRKIPDATASGIFWEGWSV